MWNVKNRTIENVAAIMMGIIIAIGIICEIIVHCGSPLWIIPDLRNVALVILQIQAGVSTLAVALLALISGLIGVEVYGISITKYYMSIRPAIFKQKVVIIGTVSFVFMGVIAELLEWYNLVFSFFFCEWLLINISVIEIMPVFSGRKTFRREIREYLINEISCKKHEVITELLETYTTEPDARDVDEEILWHALENLLHENTDDSICLLNNKWSAMLRSQLKYNETWVVKRGLEILQKTYHKIWDFVRDNKNKCGSTMAPEVFENLYEECRIALDHLSMGELKECFHIDCFCEEVSRVNSWYMRKDQEKFKSTCRYIEWLSQYAGYLLRKKQNATSVHMSDHDLNYWGKMLENQHINNYNIPKESENNYLLHRCRVYLGYAISLVIDGHKELFDKYYLESNIYFNAGEPYEVLFRISLACYLYYLADVESKMLVPQAAKECADFVLSSRKFKTQFTDMLQHVDWKKDIDAFATFFEKNLVELLYPHERFKNGQVKQIVVEPTAQVFATFIQSYISDKHFMGSLFIEKVNREYLTLLVLNLLEGKQREKTKETFKRLYEILIQTHPSMNIEKKSEALFYQWEKYIIERYKKEKINNAHRIQNQFIKEDIEETLRLDTKNHLIDHFQDRFGLIMDQCMTDGDERTINLFELISDTDYLLSEKSLHEVYDNLDGILLDSIADLLYKKERLQIYDRSEKQDVDFLDDMKDEQINLLIGSEFEFLEKDLENWKVFRDFFEEMECVFIGEAKSAMAIRNEGIKFAIRDINVSVQEPSLEDDYDVKYNEESDQYSIRLVNDIAGMFTKEEAENYIKNQRKITNISVTMAVKVPKEIIGFLIENNDI